MVTNYEQFAEIDLTKVVQHVTRHVSFIQEHLSLEERRYLLREAFLVDLETGALDVFENVLNFDLLSACQDMLRAQLIQLATQLLSCEPAVTPCLTEGSQAFEDFFGFLPLLDRHSNDSVLLATLDFYVQFLSFEGLEPVHAIEFMGKGAFFEKLEQIVFQATYSQKMKDKVFQILFQLLFLAQYKMLCSFQRCADIVAVLLEFLNTPNQSSANVNVAA